MFKAIAIDTYNVNEKDKVAIREKYTSTQVKEQPNILRNAWDRFQASKEAEQYELRLEALKDNMEVKAKKEFKEIEESIVKITDIIKNHNKVIRQKTLRANDMLKESISTEMANRIKSLESALALKKK